MSDTQVQLERGIAELFERIAMWRANPEHPDELRNLIGALKVTEMMVLEELIRVTVTANQGQSIQDAIGSALQEFSNRGGSISGGLQ